MKKIGLFLMLALLTALGPMSLMAKPGADPMPQVLVQERSPEVKFETLRDLLNDLKLVGRKTIGDNIRYEVEFRMFSWERVNEIVIKAVPTEIKTRYYNLSYYREFLGFEAKLIESYKTFVLDSEKIRGITTEKSVDINVTLEMESSFSLSNEEVAPMIEKINRAIRENKPLTFICDGVRLYPSSFYEFDSFSEFNSLSRINISLLVKEIKED